MAIDFSKGMSRKAPQAKGKMDFTQAKQAAQDNLDNAIKAVKAFVAKAQRLPTGNEMPAGLVKVGADGDTCIGWRIANKPVHFNQKSKDAYYGIGGGDWEADLRSLAAEIKAGKHEDVLLEAFERPSKPASGFMIEKRQARAAAKQAGASTFQAGGNTYRTKDGKKA